MSVDSTPGLGSTFTAVIPMVYGTPDALRHFEADPARTTVLLVEDDAETALFYERALAAAGYQLLTARSVREARDALAAAPPRAILLDIALRGEDTWELLTELKRRPDTRGIPSRSSARPTTAARRSRSAPTSTC